MRSVRTKIMLLTAIVVIATLGISTAIGAVSIRNLGRSDADQMLHLTASTGAMGLETYFDSVERSADTVATLVQDGFEGMPFEDMESQVERARNLFGAIAYNTNGVLTYYFRIDPEISETAKGFWYVNQDGEGFKEHEVTDISQYDTNDTSALVWFTVPKATGEGTWLPPYYTENLGARVISYNVPVYWKDQFVGVIGIEIDYEMLAQEVENIKIFDTGYAFILDEDSNVVYHPQLDSMQLNLETTAIGDPDQFIGSNHVKYNFEGVEKEAVWVPLSNGMRLYVTAPVSEINRGWESLIWNMLIASLVILAVSSIVILGFSGSLTKPLRELTEAARRVDDGDYDVTLEYDANDEIGALTRTFKQLAANVREHISDLDKKVYVDALTGVRNKGAYGAIIAELQECLDTSEECVEFAMGVFDCDSLKAVNDTYGHEKGDIYLKAACRLICRIFQHSPVFRIGGDEFAVVLRGDDLLNKDELFNQFEQAEKDVCEHAENAWDRVNVTYGVAVYDPDLDAGVIDVARRADQLMYEGKHRKKARGSQR